MRQHNITNVAELAQQIDGRLELYSVVDMLDVSFGDIPTRDALQYASHYGLFAKISRARAVTKNNGGKITHGRDAQCMVFFSQAKYMKNFHKELRVSNVIF